MKHTRGLPQDINSTHTWQEESLYSHIQRCVAEDACEVVRTNYDHEFPGM